MPLNRPLEVAQPFDLHLRRGDLFADEPLRDGGGQDGDEADPDRITMIAIARPSSVCR